MLTLGLQVRTVSAVDKVPREAWNALVPADAAPVVRWEWLHALEASKSAVKARGWEAEHLTAWRDGKLVGAAAAWRKHHSMGEYVYDFGWANAADRFGVRYYPKLLVGVPLSPITAPRFLVAPGEDAAQVRGHLLAAAREICREDSLSSLHVIFPPEPEALALEQAGLFRRLSMQYHWKNPGYRTYDDYLSRFDSKRRAQLKRERGAAAKQGIAVRTLRGAELGPKEAQLAWRFYEATSARNAWGSIQLTPEFFERAFASLPEHVELVVAERKGKVIAGAFNLATPKRLYGRYWGCFEEHPFLHFHVCLYHSIDECIRDGKEAFEPGAGGEHKIPRGFAPTAIHSAHELLDARFSLAVRRAVELERAELSRIIASGEAVAGLKPWTGGSR